MISYRSLCKPAGHPSELFAPVPFVLRTSPVPSEHISHAGQVGIPMYILMLMF